MTRTGHRRVVLGLTTASLGFTLVVGSTVVAGSSAAEAQAATPKARTAGTVHIAPRAPRATTNPCWSRAGVLHRDQGWATSLPALWGGYTYTWDQGWLIVWDRGTPFRAYWPDWDARGCPT